MSFRKILVAYRGEIACRIVRTAHALGYSTTAVYSDADAHAQHVLQADEAVRIGAGPAADSYLNVAALLAAARATGADALHPGYGFLSESAVFAQACLDAGLVFIGPAPSAILAMGHKARAKQRMIAAGVPCVPGYLGANQVDAHLVEEGERLGLPLMVKAVAGGGGRGMRVVRYGSELAPAIADARREALASFGDGELMLERLVEAGRHIEIQIFADAHGNAVHLGERDCTMQRRRQKLVEESPSPSVSASLRAKMGSDAVTAALAVGYQGAGTIEFMLDSDGQHYFLEMNTRLQVEHPVTEMVTGLDLVAWQLIVAAGQPLPLIQSEIVARGHAIEARLCAEDPCANFAPQTGKICWWRPQDAESEGARIDSGVAQGDVVTPFYDSMLAKVIVHGRDRDEAIRKLRRALVRAPLLGLHTNAQFLSYAVDHPAFRHASMNTGTVDEWSHSGAAVLQRQTPGDLDWALAASLFAVAEGVSWRSNSVAAYGISLLSGHAQRLFRVRPNTADSGPRTGLGSVIVGWDSNEIGVTVHSWQDGRVRFESGGVIRQALGVLANGVLHLHDESNSFAFSELPAMSQTDEVVDATKIMAHVAGKVTQVLAATGACVVDGSPLVCVEAMKMEMWLSAKGSGTVTAVHVVTGDQVETGTVLVELELGADVCATGTAST